MSEEAFIYEAIHPARQTKARIVARSHIEPGRRPDRRELRKRHPDLDENLISDVNSGPRLTGGRRHAHAAVLASGMPVTSGGVQSNWRPGASGLEQADNTAAQKARSGWDDLLAGGVVDEPGADKPDGGAMGLDRRPTDDVMFVLQGIGADLIATIERLLPRRRRRLRATQ